MSRFVLFGILALLSAMLRAQQNEESFEVEPPLFPQNQKNESPSAPTATPAPIVDLARLEKDLERARKNAAGAERLFKIGALAKVEAEARTLKVIRLESDLETARLVHAKEEALARQASVEASEATNATKIETDLAHAIQAAHDAAAKRDQAELHAAEMNLFRQQKLLVLGSGSKTIVRRAEEKLAELQQKTQ